MPHVLPTRREARAARGQAPHPAAPGRAARWTSRGVPLLLAGCAAAVLLSSLTLPARPDAAAAAPPRPVAAAPDAPSRPARAEPAAGPAPASPRRTTTRPAAAGAPAHDGTRVTLILRSRPRTRTDQEFGIVGRHLGTVVLDDPARSDGDAARRSATFDTGRGGFVLAWRSRDGWALESLSCTTTEGNLATTVRSTVVVVTAGRGEVRCTAVVARS